MPPFIPNGNTVRLELAHPLQVVGSTVFHFKNAPLLLVEVQEGQTDGPIMTVPPAETQLVAIREFEGAMKTGNKELITKAISFFQSIFETRQEGKAYRIAERSLPSYEDLINWARYDISLKANLVPEDMECALDDFLDGYIKHTPQLPMVSTYIDANTSSFAYRSSINWSNLPSR